MTDQPEWLTTDEVAEHYRRPVSTIRYWKHIGYGPRGTRVGTGVLYPRAEIQRFDRELAKRAAAGDTAFQPAPGGDAA